MFNLFKNPASQFISYFKQITSIPAIKKSKFHKPITAAYLFVLLDLTMMFKGRDKRLKEARKIFSTLESELLSQEELEVFDKATELFGSVLRGEVEPRGDFCHYNGALDNNLFNLYLCFGDLIYHYDYLLDYENSPIFICDISNTIDFLSQITKVNKLAIEYFEKLQK